MPLPNEMLLQKNNWSTKNILNTLQNSRKKIFKSHPAYHGHVPSIPRQPFVVIRHKLL